MSYIAKRFDQRYWACIWNRKGHKHRPLISSFPVFDIQRLIKEKIKELPNSYMMTLKDKNILKLDVCKTHIKVYPEEGYKPQVLAVTAVRCGLGGERYLIECTCCKKKYRYLYIIQGYLACRKCLNLIYPCQLQTQDMQCIFMESKIEQLLSKGGKKWDGYTKPFYMHRKTYERLRDRYRKYEEKHAQYIAKIFGLNGSFF